MLRALPVVVALALTIYCFLDCVQTDGARVQALPKNAWLLVIVLLPLLGALGWLLAGRPRGTPRGGPTRRGPAPPRGPDDDPDFLRGL
ncbi:MAG TPA: PLDc N-terminal domain-containing protein [Dermatophilaceae bacterium]|nr:PLDc N-terminal domain-containing protein [Dermatophilaceae bacterium]